MPSLTQGSSHSSDYFDDDPEFVKALNEVHIPETSVEDEPPLAQRPKPAVDEPPPTQPSRKRARPSDDEFEEEDGIAYHNVMNAVDAIDDGEGYLDSHTYGAARFGEFGEYMSRKRAKLQIQNTEMGSDDDDEIPRSRIFQGLQLYVRVLSALYHGDGLRAPCCRSMAGQSRLCKTCGR